MSDMSRSSTSPASLPALGLRPRLAPVPASADFLTVLAAFFFTTGSATASTWTSSTAALTLDLDAGTRGTFGSVGLLAVFLTALVLAAGAAEVFDLEAGMYEPQNDDKRSMWSAAGRPAFWKNIAKTGRVRQDGWANIWCAVLAARWPDALKCIVLAGSGGAAVALAWAKNSGLYLFYELERPRWCLGGGFQGLAPVLQFTVALQR